MDVTYQSNAGAIVEEHTNAPFILNIVTPAHPCARDIPFILNIKKAVKKWQPLRGNTYNSTLLKQ
jgi:hypothetical protein